VSRAARTPSLGERFVNATILAFPDHMSGMKVQLAIAGNPNFQSEYLTAYEAGHRIARGPGIYTDFSLFWNRYSGLSGVMMGAPQFVMAPAPHIVITEIFQNGFAGNAYGGELALNYAVTPRWRVNAGYSRLAIVLQGPDSLTKASASDPARSPHNQFEAGSLWDLRRNVDLDTFVYVMGVMPGGPRTLPIDIPSRVPSYVRADMRLGWRPRDHVELSVGGQNLLSPKHLEQISYHVGVQSQVGRTVIGSVKWSF
jgi:iron complex outermembrane recepter protein